MNSSSSSSSSNKSTSKESNTMIENEEKLIEKSFFNSSFNVREKEIGNVSCLIGALVTLKKITENELFKKDPEEFMNRHLLTLSLLLENKIPNKEELLKSQWFKDIEKGYNKRYEKVQMLYCEK